MSWCYYSAMALFKWHFLLNGHLSSDSQTGNPVPIFPPLSHVSLGYVKVQGPETSMLSGLPHHGDDSRPPLSAIET